jgi:nucleotide-binding universal stress UspA family protein
MPTHRHRSLVDKGIFATVVVPVDFTVADERDDPSTTRRIDVGSDRTFTIGIATERALQLATRLAAGGRIRLVHATPALTHLGLAGPYGTWFPADSAAEMDRTAKQQSTAILLALADRYRNGVAVDTHVVAGPAALVILSDAAKRPPDAIVLGISGHRRLYRAFLGSTTDKVIREAPCPVIVMPQEGPLD